jgi:hypothetical protein
MFRSKKQYWQSVIAALGLVLGLMVSATIPLTQASSNPNPGVLPPNSKPYGKSYGEWSAKWWQWVLSIPEPHNPNDDLTGANSARGQSGPVWFLAGNFGGTNTRTFTVPAGKALFFPLVNQEWDNFLCSQTDTDYTIAELRAQAKPNIDLATNLACEVDGVPIKDLTNVLTTRYRVESVVFSIKLPANSVWLVLFPSFCPDALPGTYGPAIDDGIYLMLAPLPVGQHTIHFHSEIPSFGFVLDVTDHIKVVKHDDD